MSDERKTALVTGASSGIGMELARIHAERGGDVVILARRGNRLTALKDELEAAHQVKVHVLVEDLADPDAPYRVHDQLTSQGIAIDYLINNAGFGYRGLFHEQELERNEEMVQVNITAVMALTRLFVPEMISRGRGRVLNVASMAGFVPGPLQAVYYATKAFVISFTEATANELRGTGVTVTALCPGPVETEFIERAAGKKITDYKGCASARDTALCGYDAMLKGKTIIVPGFFSKIVIHGLLRLAPRQAITNSTRRVMNVRYGSR